MKKQLIHKCFFLILLMFFINQSQAQLNTECLVYEGFENSTCDPNNSESMTNPFYLGCFDGWVSTHGTADIFSPVDAYEGVVSAHTVSGHSKFDSACPEKDIHYGEGIALNYNFQEGVTYRLTYAIKEPPTASSPFSNLELEWFLLTDGFPNSTGEDVACGSLTNYPLLPETPEGSISLGAVQIINENWTTSNEHIITPDKNYKQLWLKAKNDFIGDSGGAAHNIFLDAIKIEKILDIDCDTTDTPDFAMEITCDKENKCVEVTALEQNATNHWWGLYEILDPLNPQDTSDANTVDVDGDPSNGITWVQKITFQNSVKFCNLDPDKKYYIKHGIWKENCYGWRDIRLPIEASIFHFEDESGNEEKEFCIDEDVFLDSSRSYGGDKYHIGILRRPIGSEPVDSRNPDDYTWVNALGWISVTPGTFNLSEVFRNLSTPSLDFEEGFEYLVQFAIADDSLCVTWTVNYETFTMISCVNTCETPENLHFDFLTLTWQDVEDATSYDVMLLPNDNPACLCEEGTVTLPQSIIVSDIGDTFLNLPNDFIGSCFKWRVRANCGPGLSSPYSDEECIQFPVGSNGNFTGSVSPNPNNGNMTFTFQHVIDTNVTIEVYDFYGTLLHTSNQSILANVPKIVQWNGMGVIPQGVYFVKFQANGEAIQKTVVVE
nr:T9SS type A sorting domain-containing protein [uncultured Psychroserpens sp.]